MTLEDWRKQQYRDLRVIAEDERNRHRRQAGRAHMYALEIPVSVIVGAVLGKLLDDHFHIAPWGITIGLLAGLGAAGRAIYRIIQWQRTLSDGDTAKDIGYDPPADDRDGYDLSVPPGGDHDGQK